MFAREADWKIQHNLSSSIRRNKLVRNERGQRKGEGELRENRFSSRREWKLPTFKESHYFPVSGI